VYITVRISVISDDVAGVIDPRGVSRGGAGKVNRAEAASRIKKAAAGIDTYVISDDVAGVIDPGGISSRGGAGEINRAERSSGIKEAASTRR